MNHYPFIRHISYLLILALLVITFGACHHDHPQRSEVNLSDRIAEMQFPYEGMYMLKNFPDYEPDLRAYKTSKQLIKEHNKQGLRTGGSWISQGPGNIGARVNTIALHPTDDHTMMAGFASGGVWHTVDNGDSWSPIFDDQPDLNIGDITYDPNDGNIVYVGTGDPNISGYPKIGSGVFKSTDGGNQWQYMGLASASIVSRIHVASTDSEVIYVSTMGLPFEKTEDRGVYKSTDGGNSWEHILMINDSTGVIDMIVHPEDPDIVYAAGWNRNRSDSISRIIGPDARIHKTTDGGITWTMLEGGLPIGDQLGRIGLAMSGTDYDHIYASYINTGGNDSCSSGGSQLLGIWESENAGNQWTEINTYPETGLPCNALGGFAWYFGQIRVNPNDDDDLFLLGVDMWRTRDGGASWNRAVPLWSEYAVHADKHDLVFDKDRMILATDGGLYSSPILQEEWIDIENIPTTQFYRIGHNPHKPLRYYGGAQDNGTTGGNLDEINDWERIYGGDGFQVAFDPFDSLTFYASTQRGNIVVSSNGGLSFSGANDGLDNSESTNWDTPYFVSTHDTKVLYTGRQSAYRGTNTDGDVEWTKISPILIDTTDNDNFLSRTISTIHQSPLDVDYLYVGTTDGLVWSSLDGGQTWNDISEGVPYRYISDIVASPTFSSSAYVAVTGYKSNDFRPYLYRTDDHGETWTVIQGDLPLTAINDILVHPNYEDQVICVATDGGVYITTDAGEHWDRLGDNMPIIEVYDLAYNPVLDQLVAGTFARGIQTFDLTQIDLNPSTSTIELATLSFEVYPSPAIDKIHVDHSSTNNLSYTVRTANGQSVLQGKLSQDGGGITISALQSGIYYITLSDEGRIGTQSFIKL